MSHDKRRRGRMSMMRLICVCIGQSKAGEPLDGLSVLCVQLEMARFCEVCWKMRQIIPSLSIWSCLSDRFTDERQQEHVCHGALLRLSARAGGKQINKFDLSSGCLGRLVAP